MAGLPEMLTPYEPQKVFNADEMGWYWKMTRRKTLVPAVGDRESLTESQRIPLQVEEGDSE